MSTTIIDALLVSIGLDPKTFVQGAKVVNDAQAEIEKNAKRTTKETDDAERKLDSNRRRRSRDTEVDTRRRARVERDEERSLEAERKKLDKDRDARNKSLRNQALGLFALFTAGKSIKDFIGDTIATAAGLGYLSANLRMSTEDITAWQRASERAGGSKDGIVEQLKQSTQDIAALKTGLGPSEGMQWFFRMGGSSSDLKDGNTYLLARSKIVKELFDVDPSKAALVAAQMGISADQFNLIKQGPAAILALVDAQRKNSAISEKDAAAALALRNRWLDFKASLEATTVKILVASIPAMETFVGWMQSLMATITDNKDVIGKWASELVDKVLPILDGIGKALKDADWTATKEDLRAFGLDIATIAKALREVVDLWAKLTGGSGGKIPTDAKGIAAAINNTALSDPATDAKVYKNRKSTPADAGDAEFFPHFGSSFKVFTARFMASLGNRAAGEYIRDVTGHDDYKVGPKVTASKMDGVIKYLMTAGGWTREQATGIASNLVHESNLNPSAMGDSGKAYGIGQWHPDRQLEFKAAYGKDIRGSTLDEQLGFVNYELRYGNEKAAGDKIAAAKTAAEAAAIASRMYERPKNVESEAAKRAATAGALDAAHRAGNAATARGGAPAGNVKTDVKIGSLIINTKATDAAGIARDLPGQLEKSGFGFAMQANTGVA